MQHRRLAVPGEPRLRLVEVLALEQRHPVDEPPQPDASGARAGLVQQQRPEHRPDGGRDDHQREVHAAARGEVAGEGEHDLAGDRREDVLGEDEDADADLAQGVHHVGRHACESGQLCHPDHPARGRRGQSAAVRSQRVNCSTTRMPTCSYSASAPVGLPASTPSTLAGRPRSAWRRNDSCSSARARPRPRWRRVDGQLADEAVLGGLLAERRPDDRAVDGRDEAQRRVEALGVEQVRRPLLERPLVLAADLAEAPLDEGPDRPLVVGTPQVVHLDAVGPDRLGHRRVELAAHAPEAPGRRPAAAGEQLAERRVGVGGVVLERPVEGLEPVEQAVLEAVAAQRQVDDGVGVAAAAHGVADDPSVALEDQRAGGQVEARLVPVAQDVGRLGVDDAADGGVVGAVQAGHRVEVVAGGGAFGEGQRSWRASLPAAQVAGATGLSARRARACLRWGPARSASGTTSSPVRNGDAGGGRGDVGGRQPGQRVHPPGPARQHADGDRHQRRPRRPGRRRRPARAGASAATARSARPRGRRA